MIALSLIICGTTFMPTKAYASATVLCSSSTLSFNIVEFYMANGKLVSTLPNSSSDSSAQSKY